MLATLGRAVSPMWFALVPLAWNTPLTNRGRLQTLEVMLVTTVVLRAWPAAAMAVMAAAVGVPVAVIAPVLIGLMKRRPTSRRPRTMKPVLRTIRPAL